MLFVKDNLITFPVSGFFSGKSRDILRRIKPHGTKLVNPHKHLIKEYLLQIKNSIHFYSKSYENVILIGDFDSEISDSHMDSFCAMYHLTSD